MEEWRTYKINEVCQSVSETYRGNATSVVLINTSDVLDGEFLNHEKVPNKDLKGQFKKVFYENDILYSEIRPANKRFAFVGFEPQDYIASTKLMVIRANDKVLPRFLFHHLKSDQTICELQALAESRSGTFPQITFSELGNLEISLPPIETQERIVGFLDSIENKIALNNRINHNLEEQAQALYKSWFVDFEPFKDGKFVESELGMIPEGWSIKKAEDFCEINIGKTPPRKEHQWFSNDSSDVTWISISDMGASGMYISSSSEMLTKEACRKFNVIVVPEGTVLLSFKLTVGRVSIASKELTTNEAIARFLTSSDALRSYLYLALKLFDYSKLGSTSSIATAVNSKIIKGMPLLCPPADVLDRFDEHVKGMFNSIKTLQDEISCLREQRDSLLPRLMSGEINC